MPVELTIYRGYISTGEIGGVTPVLTETLGPKLGTVNLGNPWNISILWSGDTLKDTHRNLLPNSVYFTPEGKTFISFLLVPVLIPEVTLYQNPDGSISKKGDNSNIFTYHFKRI